MGGTEGKSNLPLDVLAFLGPAAFFAPLIAAISIEDERGREKIWEREEMRRKDYSWVNWEWIDYREREERREVYSLSETKKKREEINWDGCSVSSVHTWIHAREGAESTRPRPEGGANRGRRLEKGAELKID